jgi:hypothetical protein
MRVFALASSLLFGAGCGGGATILATTPIPDGAAKRPAFLPPAGRLRFEAPAAAWSPMMHGEARAGAGLTDALAARASVMIVLGAELSDATWEERVVRMVKAASKDTAVVARAHDTLETLLEERGEIPYRVTMEPAGTDAYGQPYYLPREHPLNTDWLMKRKALKGAEALLTVRRVTPDLERLKELRRLVRGGCAEVSAALGAQRDAATRYFDALVAQADEALADAFKRHLEKALPFWRSEIETRRTEEGPSADVGCLDAYRTFVESYAPCLGGACALQPKLYAGYGGIIAMDEGPANAVPPRCAAIGGRDYVGELREVAGRAAAEIAPAVPEEYVGELVRLGAFEDAMARLDDFCGARHRRFTETDVAAGVDELKRLVEAIAAAEVRGELAVSKGQERVAGVGPARVLARVQPTGSDLRAASAEVFDRLAGTARCTSGAGEDVLQAAVIDVGTSEVVFMGLYFEEQLLCEDLAPLRP